MISFEDKNFLIAFIWEVELIPELITFFGISIVLLVKDKKITSSTSLKSFKFSWKTGPITIFIPSSLNSYADFKAIFGSDPESFGIIYIIFINIIYS